MITKQNDDRTERIGGPKVVGFLVLYVACGLIYLAVEVFKW